MSKRIPYTAIIATLLVALAIVVAVLVSFVTADAPKTVTSASGIAPAMEARDVELSQEVPSGDAAAAVGAAATESADEALSRTDDGETVETFYGDEAYASYEWYAEGDTESYDDGGYAYGGSRVAYDPMYNADGPNPQMPGWYGGEEDGYVETYYSSNVLYHSMTDQWTLDDEGFYHDANGRYVIGVSDSERDELPYGSVVMTGKGEAVVYDYGSGIDNVHDFYTNW